MGRMLRIIIGLALIGYGIYSGNSWFYLGVIPLITGLINWCPMEKLMGECKDENCSTVSCGTSSKKTKQKSSCCATPDEQIAQFSAIKPEEKAACCS